MTWKHGEDATIQRKKEYFPEKLGGKASVPWRKKRGAEGRADKKKMWGLTGLVKKKGYLVPTTREKHGIFWWKNRDQNWEKIKKDAQTKSTTTFVKSLSDKNKTRMNP